MYYIDAGVTLFVHFYIISMVFEDSSGLLGLREDGKLLDSALALCKQTFDGRELYPSIEDKATALLRSMVLNHPFIDGNKRTALICTLLFLDINGYYVDATEKQLFRLMLSITRGSRQETTKRWFKKHIKKVKPGSNLGWWERIRFYIVKRLESVSGKES